MVNAVSPIDKKIEKAFKEVKKAKDPIELEDAQIKLDNLLDIRLAQTSKETVHGD